MLPSQYISRLCEFVDQAEESHKLIQLLLPYLVNNRIKHESSLVNALRSVKLLMEFAEKSAEFLDQLAPLFQLVRSRPARAALCDILKVLGDRNSECSQFVDIVVRLNCWDPKRVEEPDYKARLSAHKELNHLMDMSENKLDQRFARLVLNNLAFAMANNEDMSLRDSASNSLLLLMRRIAADTTDDAKTRNSFVTKQIIPVVKTGLKSEMEVTSTSLIS